MRRTALVAVALQTVAWAGPVEVTDLQRPSGWMLALLVGVGVKIFRTLGRS